MGVKTEKANKLKSNRGPTLDSFLEEEGLKSELSAIVAKQRIAYQLQQAMKKKRTTKVKLAALLDTSCTQEDRILDPIELKSCSPDTSGHR